MDGAPATTTTTIAAEESTVTDGHINDKRNSHVMNESNDKAESAATASNNVSHSWNSFPTSRLSFILQSFHNQLCRIDALEERLNERVVRTRRRMTQTLLANAASAASSSSSSAVAVVGSSSAGSENSGQPATTYRSSHLRLFVTHRIQNLASQEDRKDRKTESTLENSAASATTTNTSTTAEVTLAATAVESTDQTFKTSDVTSSASAPEPSSPSSPLNQRYYLLVEGTLLIAHLDHKSARDFDARTGYTPPNDDLDRSKGETEEEQVVPIRCTHLFDKLIVTFEPYYYQSSSVTASSVSSLTPRPASKKLAASKKSSKKSSRRSSNAAPIASTSASVEEEAIIVDPASLIRGPQVSRLEWIKNKHSLEEKVKSDDDGNTKNTDQDDENGDAHGWNIVFDMPEAPTTMPSSPQSTLMPYSVVATIQLYPSMPEDVYQIQQEALVASLFPNYGPVEDGHHRDDPAVEGPSTLSKKRKAEEIGASFSGSLGSGNDADIFGNAPDGKLPPLDNQIIIPQGLTMKEIIMAFFTYVQDKRLSDELDKNIIRCDTPLQAAFGTETVAFSQLPHLLLNRGLVTKISNDPVELTYILRPDTAMPTRNEDTTTSNYNTSAPTTPNLLQLDMDVSVPALFPFRTRELLRRIKRRELEYTSSRTKARYILMARRAQSEDLVKTRIDQVVAGHSLHEDLQPVLAALAKAAPPHSEARMALHYDLRMSYLLARLRERQHHAMAAWKLVRACQLHCARMHEAEALEEPSDK